jgi:hypothetical protein
MPSCARCRRRTRRKNKNLPCRHCLPQTAYVFEWEKELQDRGEASPSRGLDRGDGPDVGVRVRGTREVCVGNTFTLWGERLTPGDYLDADQRGQLAMIARNPITDRMIQKVVRDIIDAAPPEPPLSLQPLEEVVSPEHADELTMRAREALIATGQFPGMEEQVRDGMMDSLSGIQSAIAVLRDAQTPVEVIRARGHSLGQVRVAPPPPPPPVRGRIALWIERLQHRWAKLVTRYEHKIDAVCSENYRLANRVRCLEDELRQAKIGLGKERLTHRRRSSVETAVSRLGATSWERPRKEENVEMSSLAAFLNLAPESDRKPLLELAKNALAVRRVDPTTEKIVLSMVVPKFDPRK